jgi:hypothetical protein
VNFLAPWALLLAGAAAVPLLLHLLRRRTGARVDFPAVRYLLRAEREHAREVRMRNLLLMLLRVGIVLAIALAVAKPVGPFPGVGHPPTAVALLLDNSLSSGAAGASGPMLTRLTAAAAAVVDAAQTGDVLTLVTLDGEAVTAEPPAMRALLNDVVPLAGAGDPAAALRRARAVLAASPLPERRLVVLTDAQASTWRGLALDSASRPDGAIAVAVLAPDAPVPVNRGVASVSVEPSHWSPRGAVRATLLGDSASWRVVLDGRSVARGSASAGAPLLARVQPTTRGWLAGAVELEPDEMRGDDTRHFAVHVGEAPPVMVDGGGEFLRGAVEALVDGARARRGAEIMIGAAERARRPGLFFAPGDPLQLADANRALERAGVPWRFGARRSGPAPLRGAGLDGATASTWYALTAVGDAPRDTLARVGSAPWAVGGDGYVVIASPADPAATDLPLRASFVPWLDALLTERLSRAGGRALEVAPRALVTVPLGAERLEATDGTLSEVRPGAVIRAPATLGVSFWRRGDARIGALVVNAEPAESDLARLESDSLAAAFGASRVQRDAAPFARAAIGGGTHRALDTPLLLLALGLLLAESWLARRGRAARQGI